MSGLLMLPVALVLAAGFAAGIHLVGAWIVSRLRLEVSDRQAAHLAFGLTAYGLIGLALGAAGWLRWPLLAVLALLPALLAIRRLPAAISSIADTARSSISEGEPGPLTLCLLATGLVYLLAAAVPSFHYDVLVNYIGVPKDYLIQGHTGSLPHNIHSSVSFFLHIAACFLLALGEPIRTGPFLFGAAPVWGAFHLIVIAATVHRGWIVVEALGADSRTARHAVTLAALAWLIMPQTLLLALFESAEFLVTYLVVTLTGVLLRQSRRHDILVVALLGGLLVACKPQTALLALAAIGWASVGSRVSRVAVALLSAGVLPAAAQLRNLVEFGGPLFPYVGGDGPAAAAARALLAENSVTLPHSPTELGTRLWDVLTLQGETGISLVLLVALAAGKVRRLRFWVIAALAFGVPIVLSSNAHNVLRWSQPGLVLLLIGAGVNLAALIAGRRAMIWAAAAFCAAGLVMAIRFTTAVVGPTSPPADARAFLARMIPTLETRAELMERPGRVLWMGELYGCYGASKGPIPAPQNGAAIGELIGSRDPDEIRQRLADRGFRWISLCTLHDATGPGSDYWSWLEPDQRRALGELLASLPSERPQDGVTIYDLGSR
jgi:hypothetical protein